MQVKQDKYSGKNLIKLINILKFDKEGTQSFLEKYKPEIQKINSTDEITNFILAVCSKPFKGYSYNLAVIILDLFKNKLIQKYNYAEFINLISKLCESDSTHSKGITFHIVLPMVHFIKNDDMLVEVLQILNHISYDEQLGLMTKVENYWSEQSRMRDRMMSRPDPNKQNQFFSSKSSDDTTSNDTTSDETSENDSTADSSSENSATSSI